MLQELRGIIGTPEKFIRGDPRNNLPPVYDLAENKGGGEVIRRAIATSGRQRAIATSGRQRVKPLPLFWINREVC